MHIYQCYGITITVCDTDYFCLLNSISAHLFVGGYHDIMCTTDRNE
jgi:hypothetical protein